MEAFSDGVLAILITIMVLELKIPSEPTFAALAERWPLFLSYLLSFVYLGIYWNNHHHLLHTVAVVEGPTLWANNHLLFWLSFIPFVTEWFGDSHFAAVPAVLYGFVMLMSGTAYYILTLAIIRSPENAALQRATQNKFKELISIAFYLAGIAFGFTLPLVSLVLYGVVAAAWLIPDRRIEHEMKKNAAKTPLDE
jgi:uncharacterized membrane protein